MTDIHIPSALSSLSSINFSEGSTSELCQKLFDEVHPILQPFDPDNLLRDGLATKDGPWYCVGEMANLPACAKIRIHRLVGDETAGPAKVQFKERRDMLKLAKSLQKLGLKPSSALR